MGNFYLILVVVLFALAFSDLIVGVSNDAVNFLNSAIGSKAAPKWLIFLIASLGVLVGATFSSGMMEVARKGIFHPDMFFFSEIMVIFLAVMITDVILLDMFNTFGLPTSTTVSIVFELLGSAVAVSIIKIKSMGGTMLELSNYINSDKALAIITGILLSVVIAFSVGAIVQYIARLIFTFQYKVSLKYFGSMFGGVAIAAITYFILIKGMKGSSYAELTVESGETLKDYVKHNTVTLLFFSFIGWTIVMEVLKSIFKVDILKVIVLIGTFALAMAFAGNDLVNFIGVPIAGFKSFQAWSASGGVAADGFSMEMLSGKVGTPVYMLLISGLVMVVTLILSKKAQAVTQTEVNLGRQSEGSERFGSSIVARLMVRSALKFNKGLVNVMPSAFSRGIDRRFKQEPVSKIEDPKRPAFDKIRAAVNLVVASILISIGTSLKLPLSTTYVTFMVAMGTSLSDRAWDRESAVYRVSGVFAVIGGWFLTAFIAFTVSALIAWLITAGGKFMVFVFIALAIFIVMRTQVMFKRRSAKKMEEEEETAIEQTPIEKVMEKSTKQVVSTIIASNKIFSICINGFIKEDRSYLREGLALKDELNVKSKKLKAKVLKTLAKFQDEVDSGHYYVQEVDYQREVAHSLNFLVQPLFEHFDNQHKPFIQPQVENLHELTNKIDEILNFALHLTKEGKFEKLEELIQKRDTLVDDLSKLEKTQIKRIKAAEVNTRNSLLFFNIISETKNLLMHMVNLLKAHRDFITESIKSKTE